MFKTNFALLFLAVLGFAGSRCECQERHLITLSNETIKPYVKSGETVYFHLDGVPAKTTYWLVFVKTSPCEKMVYSGTAAVPPHCRIRQLHGKSQDFTYGFLAYNPQKPRPPKEPPIMIPFNGVPCRACSVMGGPGTTP